MNLKEFLFLFVPQRVYTGVDSTVPVEKQMPNGETVILRRHECFGEDVVYKCVEKQTSAMRGFMVKNIKYGYFGDLCDSIQAALASADKVWFRVFGVEQRHR